MRIWFDAEKHKEAAGGIPQIIEKYGIRSIADIGAGDLNWIKTMDLSGWITPRMTLSRVLTMLLSSTSWSRWPQSGHDYVPVGT